MTASAWRVLVPLVCLVAGFGFAASARTARGTDLRSADTGDLAATVRAAIARDAEAAKVLAGLRAQVQAATDDAAQVNSAVAAAQAKALPLRPPAGLTASSGPGLRVVLDDSHEQPPPGAPDLNQYVVHQSDLQAVVNALWAGGAEAMSVAGQRIIGTSAVRCVGNTLLLNGRVFSPPFEVVALGPADGMRAALGRSRGVALFTEAAGYYGLGYTVSSETVLRVPAYDGAVGLTYAKVG